MPFSTIDKAKIFQILGIPRGGNGLIVTSLTHLPPTLAAVWSTTWTEGQFASLVVKVQSYLDSADEATISLVQSLLVKFDDAVASPLKVSGSGDSTGVLIDHKDQLELIRQEIGKLLGVWTPRGGFIAETEKLYRMSGRGDR